MLEEEDGGANRMREGEEGREREDGEQKAGAVGTRAGDENGNVVTI